MIPAARMFWEIKKTKILLLIGITLFLWMPSASTGQDKYGQKDELKQKLVEAKIQLQALREQRMALERELAELQGKIAKLKEDRDRQQQNSQFAALRSKLDKEGKYLIEAENKISLAEAGAYTSYGLSQEIERVEDLLLSALQIEIKIREDIESYLKSSDERDVARFSQIQVEVDSLSTFRTDLVTRMEGLLTSIESLSIKEVNLAKPMIYLVKKGDWLWKIADKKEIYGNGSLWPKIYRANSDQIRDPNLIYPNQKFLIPR